MWFFKVPAASPEAFKSLKTAIEQTQCQRRERPKEHGYHMQKKLGKRDGLKRRVSNTPKHQPEEALTNDASEFPETDMADPDIPETDAALDSDLRGFCAHQSISLAMDKQCNDSDSNSS